MPFPLKKYLLSQSLVALAAGLMLGALLGAFAAFNPAVQAIEQTFELAGGLTLAWLRVLAVPLIFASIVLGGAGLEAMRTTGKLVGKAVAWMLGTSLLAVATGFVIAWSVDPTSAVAVPGTVATLDVQALNRGQLPPGTAPWAWGWMALVFLSLGFGYYRNQLDEGHGKLFMRFCQALEGMVNPLVRLTEAVGAIAIFVLVTVSTARLFPYWQAWSRSDALGVAHAVHDGWPLLAAAVAYPASLMLAVWVRTRIGPWRYVPALIPPMLLAATGQSIEAALPLTMEAVRRRIGVSNRVASAVLPLGAGLHRDGLALLWVVAAVGLIHPGAGPAEGHPWIALGITAFTLGIGGHALLGQTGVVSGLFLGLSGWGSAPAATVVLAWIVVSLGNAISVFSHACAALIIARGEGEYWVPGPPPAAEEIQGLKTDLELADS